MPLLVWILLLHFLKLDLDRSELRNIGDVHKRSTHFSRFFSPPSPIRHTWAHNIAIAHTLTRAMPVFTLAQVGF